MFKENSIAYSEDAKILGGIGIVNYLDNTVTLIDDEKRLHVFDIEDVKELEKIGQLGEFTVFQGDVLQMNNSHAQKFEIDVMKDGLVRFYKLNQKLERLDDELKPFERSNISTYDGTLELLGSIYELRDELPTVSFNLRIVRMNRDGDFIYFYAGNDKTKETVDLIKVIFQGHHIIEEEEYERQTLTYDEYLKFVTDGKIKEVNAMELANYVTGLLYGQDKKVEEGLKVKAKASIEIESELVSIKAESINIESVDETPVYPPEKEIELCNICNENDDDCDCGLWNR